MAIVCGDENIHFMKLTAEKEIEFIPSTVPTSKKKRERERKQQQNKQILTNRVGDFFIRKARWHSNGKNLLLLDQQLYCLAEMT